MILEGIGLNGILGLGEILGLGGILGLDGNTKFFRSKPAAQQSGPDPEKGGSFFGICKVFFKFLTHFLLESFYLCIRSLLQTAVKFIHTQSKHFVI